MIRKFLWKNKIAITACTLTIAFSIGFWVLSQVPAETSVGDDLIVAGNVGIGTTNPSHRLDIRGPIRNTHSTTYDVWIQGGAAGSGDDRNLALIGEDEDSGDRLILNWGTEYAAGIYMGGNIRGDYGNYHVASDERLKKDIVTIPNALEKVLALRGVNFKWKDDGIDNGTFQMGMIAQEVEKVVPEVVHTTDDEIETKAIEYQYMIGLLVEAIKEQQKEIDDLKTKLNIGQ